jgi:hypothetical protein
LIEGFKKARRVLEELFFLEQDRKLIEKLKQQAAEEAKKIALSDASGIKDEAVLEQLIKICFGPGTLSAFSLVPLIEVAWTDKELQEKEIGGILQAAEKLGIEEGCLAYKMLKKWLTNRPPEELFSAWMDYTKTLCSTLDKEQKDLLRLTILGRARGISDAAGGFILFVRKTSQKEQAVIDKLELPFIED